MLIPNLFFLKTVNNFDASQPFGLYNIFNYLICSHELIAGSMLRFKGLWLLRIPLSICQFDDKCQKGFTQGKLSCISLCLLNLPFLY